MTLYVSPTSHDWMVSPQAGMKPCIADSRNVLAMKLCHSPSFIDFNQFFIWNDMGFHLESMVQICDLQSGSFLNVSMLLILSEIQTPLDLFFHM